MTSDLIVESIADTHGMVQRLPGRKHPGIVIQGDTLFSIVTRLIEAVDILGSVESELAREGIDLLNEVAEALRHELAIYESALTSEGWQLPYSGP